MLSFVKKTIQTGLLLISGVMLSIVAIASTLPNPQVQKISQLIPLYEKISQQDWPAISSNSLLKASTNNPNIALIRQRLMVLGDMPSSSTQNTIFDQELVKGIKHFQWRHGLDADGVIGPQTLAALNISPAQRLQQLYINLHRWEKFPNLGANYVWVNIPNYELEFISEGKNIFSTKVIVGKPELPTPILYSHINTIVLNPPWNVPNSIIKKEIIPKMLQNPDYLAKNNMRIYSNWENNAYVINPYRLRWQALQGSDNFPYKISQLPGKKNSLGEVKFVFDNSEDVYMHDTPAKDLFNSTTRALSHGCVRVDQPFKLVDYFIQNTNINDNDIASYVQTGKTKYLPLKTTIPIYIGYITAWVDQDNQAHFREDIYKKDGGVSAQN